MQRKKPTFIKKDWHKKIKLGSTVKRNRKWRAAKGRHNKTRLGMAGNPRRPKIGWGNKRTNEKLTMVENITQANAVSKNENVMIAHIGKKKRTEIITILNSKGAKIMNKYLENKNATK